MKEVVPMFLSLIVIILRHVHKTVQFGMIERPFMPLCPQVPIIPHLGEIHILFLLCRTIPDELRPIATPLLFPAGFVVHAIKYVVEL